jgi:hypothetical protein
MECMEIGEEIYHPARVKSGGGGRVREVSPALLAG